MAYLLPGVITATTDVVSADANKWTDSIRYVAEDRPQCKVITSDTETSASGVTTDVDFDAVAHDPLTMWDSLNPTYITIPTAGFYLVTGSLYATGGIAADFDVISLREVSGSAVIMAQSVTPRSSTAGYSRPPVTWMGLLSVDDQIALSYSQSSAATVTIGGNGQRFGQLSVFMLSL